MDQDLTDRAVDQDHVTHEAEKVAAPGAADAQALEKQKVAGAIRTDFILSAEIMTVYVTRRINARARRQGRVLGLVAATAITCYAPISHSTPLY